MLPKARHKLFVRVLVTSAFAFAMLVAHAIYVLSDPDDDEFYKKPDSLKWFDHVFESTVWKVDYYIIRVDQPGSWFGHIQSTGVQFAVIFAFWWIVIFGAVLVIGTLRQRAAIAVDQ